MDVSVNYLAILIAAIASFVVGMVWFGPLFGKQWMQMMGIKHSDMEAAKKKGMSKTYAAATAGQLVMAYVVAHFVALLKITDLTGAWQFAFWAWLGLIATVQLGMVLWEQKPVKLYALVTLQYFVALGVMTSVLVLWK